jgi:secreted PhoX family phosphatase
MTKYSRRQLLAFFGASVGAVTLSPLVENKFFGIQSNTAQAANGLNFTPVRLPHALSVYQTNDSYLATGLGQGTIVPASNNLQLPSYEVMDDVVVPPEYERYVIVSWGDRVFPNEADYVGYNNDYTSFIPIDRSSNNGYLWVNHEYVSYPWSKVIGGDDLAEFPDSFPLVIGFDLPTEVNREFLGEALYNQGGSVVRLNRDSRGGQYTVDASDPNNRRYHGLSGLAINQDRTDGYQNVTAWGSRPHQQGDQNFLIGTGPAAVEVFEAVNSDGLGNRIIGTAFNCSGGTTPWGTILTAEENFQGAVSEGTRFDGRQFTYRVGTVGEEFGLVGEKYGWMVEIDPRDPMFQGRKHTALGRFRHENIAFRVEAGKPLIAYQGDDRRGGHTWKYVSNGMVMNPFNPSNSELFEDGTLYVARFNPDGTGEWIPLTMDTPTNPIPPTVLSSVEFEALGEAQQDGHIRLPQRTGIGGATEDGDNFEVTRSNEAEVLPDYQNKTLRDFYSSQGAVLVDAFLAANLVGGTPGARPEDLEVNPRNKEVIIAYTSGVAGGDGYPDSRIFQVAKLSPDPTAPQPFGGLYKIVEGSSDGTGTTFTWENFVPSGEAATLDGGGYANVDNLGFDSEGNVWGVTDMSTSRHNGFRTGANPEERTIDHTFTGGDEALVGVFGNNWLFYVPMEGENAGQVVPFAYGPPRCEMTGPTFVGDTLMISVQHPGEGVPFDPPAMLSREIEMLDLDGSLYPQQRSVPRGSNFPGNITGETFGGLMPSRPAVIGIRRKVASGRFV